MDIILNQVLEKRLDPSCASKYSRKPLAGLVSESMEAKEMLASWLTTWVPSMQITMEST